MSADCTCRPVTRRGIGLPGEDGISDHEWTCAGPPRIVAYGTRPDQYDVTDLAMLPGIQRPRFAGIARRRTLRLTPA